MKLIPKNPSFLHPATTMATYQHNPLFTIQKLGIPGAAATKISIFWYPETSIKQQSSSQAAKQHSSKVPSQQLSSQAGTKMPRYQDFFPRENHFVYFPRFLPVCKKSLRVLSGLAAVLRTSISFVNFDITKIDHVLSDMQLAP